jgi:hypothetical protein
MSTPTRTTLAVWAFAGCWCALILRLFGRRGAAERLLPVCAVAFILFTSSAATSILQERAAEFAESTAMTPQGSPGGTQE